jgi:hypothetical protein
MKQFLVRLNSLLLIMFFIGGLFLFLTDGYKAVTIDDTHYVTGDFGKDMIEQFAKYSDWECRYYPDKGEPQYNIEKNCIDSAYKGAMRSKADAEVGVICSILYHTLGVSGTTMALGTAVGMAVVGFILMWITEYEREID